MAYQQPMVMVYQEYDSTGTTTTTAELPACIVGPCIHIIDPVEDEALALFGTYTKSGIDSGMFPNNVPGALIQRDSVVFRFKNALAEIATVSTITATAPGPMVVEEGSWDDEDGDDDSGDDITIDGVPLSDTGTSTQTTSTSNVYVCGTETAAKAVVGDYVKFSSVSGDFRVTGKTENSLILNRICPSSGTISLQRKIAEVTVTPDNTDAGYVYLDLSSERFSLGGIKAVIDGVAYPIQTAELYVGYKALRQDLSDISVIYDINECEARLGKISPDNPLAFGVSIALANSTDNVGVQAIGVDSDDLEGYTRAKDRLEQQDPVYGIVPLTFDTGILTMFKQHCMAYSDPIISKWRMVFGCTHLTKTKELCVGAGTISRDGDGDLVVLKSVIYKKYNTGEASDTDIAEFLSSNVDAGDTLIITDATGTEHTYTIATVAAEDLLTITQSAPFDAGLFNTTDVYSFRITHDMDRTEQAKWLAEASKAYNYRRFVNIYPDICIVDDEEVPGYYLGCAVAAGVASLPSHYGMTRLSMAGISGVRNSSDYFNNDQLDTIAGGGTLIFVQATPESAPYIRHQLTTDISAVEFQELSFVKNFDYVSYICRDAMQVYIGQWNITPETLSSMYTTLSGTLETLMLDSQPKIGSRVLQYNITSIAQLADIRDRVEAYVEVSMPYPLNTIGLHLKSVFMQITAG